MDAAESDPKEGSYGRRLSAPAIFSNVEWWRQRLENGYAFGACFPSSRGSGATSQKEVGSKSGWECEEGVNFDRSLFLLRAKLLAS